MVRGMGVDPCLVSGGGRGGGGYGESGEMVYAVSNK